MKKFITLSVLPILASSSIRLLGKMMNVATVGGEKVDTFTRNKTPIIIAFWHGRQVMMPLAYRGRSASILISQHRDGEIIATIMKNFGFRAIRGSSSRGGIPALRKLVGAGRQGQDLVITPDGPRGPARQIQMGVMSLAKLTGFPIVPLTFACSKKKVFSSWDSFQIPLPWSKGLFVWGEPIWVTSNQKKDDLLQQGVLLERELNRLTDHADLAVQQADPVTYFLHNANQELPASSK